MSRSFWTVRAGSDRNGPLGPDRGAELLGGVMVVGRDRADLGVRDGDLRIVRRELKVLLVLLRAVAAPCQGEDQRVVTLQLAELAHRIGVIRQGVVRKGAAWFDVRSHGSPLPFSASTRATPR